MVFNGIARLDSIADNASPCEASDDCRAEFVLRMHRPAGACACVCVAQSCSSKAYGARLYAFGGLVLAIHGATYRRRLLLIDGKQIMRQVDRAWRYQANAFKTSAILDKSSNPTLAAALITRLAKAFS